MSKADLVVTRLASKGFEPKQNGKGWMCRCPAHDDNRASLSIDTGDDGRALVHCFAGCSVELVCQAIGFSVADLMPEKDSKVKKDNRIVATYNYCDEKGQLLFQKIRRANKTFSQRRPVRDGQWIWNLEGVRKVIYRLPELLKADKSNWVFVCEGEKDVDNVSALGLPSTCNSDGAAKINENNPKPVCKWTSQHAGFLVGYRVVILPDNDKAGQDHAQGVAESLVGKAKEIKILKLPGLPPKGDVSDWLASGGTRNKLLKLADEAKAFQPGENQQTVVEKNAEEKIEPPTISAGKILVDYLAKIREGKLPQLIKQRSALDGIEVGEGLVTVIGAPPGQGKTALASQIMFDALELDEAIRVVVANAETSFEGLLRREFARMTRIKSDDVRFGRLDPKAMEAITEASTLLLPRLQRVSVLNDPHDLEQLLRLRDEEPGLVVVDYLQKFAPFDKDPRIGVNMVMSGMRSLAKRGWKVLCLSATTRAKDGKHDSKSLTLSSFKESGEIEFNADSCYLLCDQGPERESQDYIRKILLKHVKNRHGAKRDIPLIFHMPRMEFSKPKEPEPSAHPEFNDWADSDANDPFCTAEVSF